jgi:hypothetical protein
VRSLGGWGDPEGKCGEEGRSAPRCRGRAQRSDVRGPPNGQLHAMITENHCAARVLRALLSLELYDLSVCERPRALQGEPRIRDG